MTEQSVIRSDHGALLRAMCAELRARLDAAGPRPAVPQTEAPPVTRASGLPPLVAAVAKDFGLSIFEAEMMALALAAEIDPGVSEALRARQPGGDPRPSFGLGFAVLTAPHWSALSPERPLLRWRLLHADAAPLVADAPLSLDPRMLHALMGAGSADSALEAWGERAGEPVPLAPAQQMAADVLAQALDAGPAQLIGGCAEDRDAVVRCAAARSGRSVWRFGPNVPQDPAPRLRLARLIEREAVLTGMLPLLDHASPGIGPLASALESAFVLSADEPDHRPGRPARVVECPAIDFAGRRALWRRAAPDIAEGEIDRLAAEFPLGAQALAQIGAGGGDAAAIRQAARLRTRTACDGLARRRSPRLCREDIALRPAQRAALDDIAARIRHRARVLEHWGFGASGRGTGVIALFSGPSGTGKTLAAEVLASELELDLLHVDLSQVLSKWLGETEKNLERIFALAERGGAMLLFDEADALFAKRVDVKDGRDRYANMEVSYLLQRMEAFPGLAVMTTNLSGAIDDAFLRRISVVVHFPFPDAAARREIWKRVMPAAAPVGALDHARLAQLAATGGDIRNIALGAGYRAAARGSAGIGMADIIATAEGELAKLNRAPGTLRRREDET